MILGEPGQTAPFSEPGARATLDDLFCRAVQRAPDRLAIADPPNRATFTDGTPRRLTYAQADQMVSAIARRLQEMKLPLDTVVGIQLPNTVEHVLTLLGVLRAGMIAAPLPLLWRHGDLVAALSGAGAKALITCRRVGATDHARLAMHAAAAVFPIRYVCGFGSNLPDGIVGMDELYGETQRQRPHHERTGSADRAEHVSLITWDMTNEALTPVARSHAEVMAGGLAVLLEGRFEPGETFLSAVPPSSFAGIATALLPWLMTGGTLALHQPFDPETLARQLAEDCNTAILPAPVVPRLLEARLFPAHLRSVVGLWRAPERMAKAPPWALQATRFIDVACFGEACVIPSRRGASGRPLPLPYGPVTAPRGAPGAVVVAEATTDREKRLALRGPMVPRHAFPSGAGQSGAASVRTALGPVDTGYPCRLDADTQTLVITGPPAGITGVGGYRFVLRELQRLVTDIDSGGRIAALPDSFCGYRLAGAAHDAATLRRKLLKHGVNPLIADAFGN